jgi:AICAR transformylase/IMP cyclohydrolase PurH
LIDEKLFGAQSKCEEVFSGQLGRLRQDSDFIATENLRDEAFLKAFGQWAGACSKSNAIVLCGSKNGVAYVAGVGQGQPNRVEALEKLALPRAKDFCARLELGFKDLWCVSDAFLPFPDVVQILHKAGITKLLQPGGSKADSVIEAEATKLGVTMEITGVRHFWH